MGCPGVVVEAVVSAGLTNAEPFEGQCGVGGPFGGPLARLPPPVIFRFGWSVSLAPGFVEARFPGFWTDLSSDTSFGLLPGGVCDFFGGEGDSFPLSLLVWQQISYKSLYNGGSVEFETLFLDLWLCFYRF